MQKQKKNYVPTINGVPILSSNAATSFTTDFIEFPESTPWSVQFDGWAGVTTAGTPKATILCSNSQNGDYSPYDASATDVDLKLLANRVLYDSIFAPRFMKIQYAAGSSIGTFNLVISK